MQKKEPSFEKVQLPYLRIEVTELLDILERVSGGKHQITGETSDVIFDNIEEIRRHKAEFAQRPTIKVGPVELETEDYSGRPTLSIFMFQLRRTDNADAVAEAQVLLNALEKELLPYSSRLANKNFQSALVVAISALASLLSVLLYQHPSSGLVYWSTLMIVYLVSAGILDRVLKKLAGDRSVFHQPRETWLQRHSVPTISAVVAAVIGAIATYLLTS
jgi:hypothetical protein